MNKATRMAAMGLGLLAAATLGTGPAQASPSTGHTAPNSSVASGQYDGWDEDDGLYNPYWPGGYGYGGGYGGFGDGGYPDGFGDGYGDGYGPGLGEDYGDSLQI
ncbi:hypothetical protein ACFQFC_07375 [Amorphoplanes digitatis]|uniref:Uncharacterized protein n=1 Tax=Actinoplanes digitatis TaxID=1868 RepID=A0A7W7I076_9ACTN|nr:hypothetical protein [Actinoplanes digitatis]MBB4764022.1 hypothetical protein [Actinoplanes digitatis]BFE73346.1 hypothetical protein GCM10020092_066470 [Actinoplanes digitatis]GID93842.1 hypothetical protein Adi01nite_32540 [Actinoplanes digitatis]